MNNTILNLLFFFFSFSFGSTENQQNLTLENSSNVSLVKVYHYLGTVNGAKQYILLKFPSQARRAIKVHEGHGDKVCDPNRPPGC